MGSRERAINERSPRLAYGIAIVAGTVLWSATSAISGKTEPWDASIYWTVAYPVAIALSGFLGYAFPQRPWRWAGLILLGILSLPAVALAHLAAKLRLRRGHV